MNKMSLLWEMAVWWERTGHVLRSEWQEADGTHHLAVVRAKTSGEMEQLRLQEMWEALLTGGTGTGPCAGDTGGEGPWDRDVACRAELHESPG